MGRSIQETEKPLYAWLAITYSFAYEAPLPEWCLDYIRTCSFEIFTLMQLVCGHDFVISLNPEPGTMPPDKAADHIAAALEVNRIGYNAFRQLLSDVENKRVAAARRSAEDMKRLSEGFPPVRGAFGDAPEKAMQAVRKRYNIADRQAKNRVTAGAKLLQWPAAASCKRKKPTP